MTIDQAKRYLKKASVWYLPNKELRFKQQEFRFRSYAAHAIDRMLDILSEEEDETAPWDDQKDPIRILENFAAQMDNFACDAKEPAVSYIFSVANDTAKCVIDDLYVLEQELDSGKRKDI